MIRAYEGLLIKAKEHIKDTRDCLDCIMYSGENNLSEEQFKCIRQAYDVICMANDILGKLR